MLPFSSTLLERKLRAAPALEAARTSPATGDKFLYLPFRLLRLCAELALLVPVGQQQVSSHRSAVFSCAANRYDTQNTSWMAVCGVTENSFTTWHLKEDRVVQQQVTN